MIPVLVLAAGRSSRFGADKRYALLESGRCVWEVTVAQVVSAGLQPRLVLPPGDPLLTQPGALAAPHCGQGMGHSIADAVAQMGAVPACMILPVDMPFIAADTLRAVANTLKTHTIAVPILGRRRGHPVGFGSELFTELQSLQGDVGARAILARHAMLVAEVPVTDPGILLDIDTPDDLSPGSLP